MLFTVMVQLNELPSTILLPTLSAFVTVISARERYTVWLLVFDVTPLMVAVALFVTEAAVKSARVTV